MTVREARPSDFAALAEVQRRSVEACLRPLYDGAAVDRWLSQLEASKFSRVAAAGEEVFVAEVDGVVVGFSSVHAEMSLVGMWYVDPGFMGRGVGAALLERAESRLVELGCEELTTEASQYARPHFESLGWVAVDEYDKAAFGGTFRVTRMRKRVS